jgi:cell division protein FtsB
MEANGNSVETNSSTASSIASSTSSSSSSSLLGPILSAALSNPSGVNVNNASMKRSKMNLADAVLAIRSSQSQSLSSSLTTSSVTDMELQKQRFIEEIATIRLQFSNLEEETRKEKEGYKTRIFDLENKLHQVEEKAKNEIKEAKDLATSLIVHANEEAEMLTESIRSEAFAAGRASLLSVNESELAADREAELTKMVLKNKDIEMKLETIEKDLSHERSNVLVLSREIDSLQATKTELINKEKTLIDALAIAESQYMTAFNKEQILQTSLTQKELEIDLTKNQLSEMTSTVVQLTEQLTAVTQARENEAKESKSKIQTVLTASASALKAMQVKLEESRVSYQDSCHEYDLLYEKFNTIKVQYDELSGKYDTIKVQYDEIVSKCDLLTQKSDLDILLASADTKVASLTLELHQSSTLLADERIECEKLRQSEKEILAENEKLRQTEKDLVAENDKLRQTEKDAVAENDKLRQTEKDLVAENDKLRQTEKDAVAENDKLRQTEKDLVAENDKLRQTEKDLVAENDKLRQTEKDLVAENDKLRQTEKDLVAENEKLRQTEKDLVAENDKLRQTEKDLVAENDKLRIAEKETHVQNDKLLEQVSLLHGQVLQLTRELKQSLARISKSAIAAKENDIAVLTSKVESLTDSLAETRKELSLIKAEKALCEAERDEAFELQKRAENERNNESDRASGLEIAATAATQAAQSLIAATQAQFAFLLSSSSPPHSPSFSSSSSPEPKQQQQQYSSPIYSRATPSPPPRAFSPTTSEVKKVSPKVSPTPPTSSGPRPPPPRAAPPRAPPPPPSSSPLLPLSSSQSSTRSTMLTSSSPPTVASPRPPSSLSTVNTAISPSSQTNNNNNNTPNLTQGATMTSPISPPRMVMPSPPSLLPRPPPPRPPPPRPPTLSPSGNQNQTIDNTMATASGSSSTNTTAFLPSSVLSSPVSPGITTGGGGVSKSMPKLEEALGMLQTAGVDIPSILTTEEQLVAASQVLSEQPLVLSSTSPKNGSTINGNTTRSGTFSLMYSHLASPLSTYTRVAGFSPQISKRYEIGAVAAAAVAASKINSVSPTSNTNNTSFDGGKGGQGIGGQVPISTTTTPTLVPSNSLSSNTILNGTATPLVAPLLGMNSSSIPNTLSISSTPPPPHLRRLLGSSSGGGGVTRSTPLSMTSHSQFLSSSLDSPNGRKNWDSLVSKNTSPAASPSSIAPPHLRTTSVVNDTSVIIGSNTTNEVDTVIKSTATSAKPLVRSRIRGMKHAAIPETTTTTTTTTDGNSLIEANK